MCKWQVLRTIVRRLYAFYENRTTNFLVRNNWRHCLVHFRGGFLFLLFHVFINRPLLILAVFGTCRVASGPSFVGSAGQAARVVWRFCISDWLGCLIGWLVDIHDLCRPYFSRHSRVPSRGGSTRTRRDTATKWRPTIAHCFSGGYAAAASQKSRRDGRTFLLGGGTAASSISGFLTCLGPAINSSALQPSTSSEAASSRTPRSTWDLGL